MSRIEYLSRLVNLSLFIACFIVATLATLYLKNNQYDHFGKYVRRPVDFDFPLSVIAINCLLFTVALLISHALKLDSKLKIGSYAIVVLAAVLVNAVAFVYTVDAEAKFAGEHEVAQYMENELNIQIESYALSSQARKFLNHLQRRVS